nr:cell wall protein DAN4-like [Procambarus clarkii]XP_045581720.1 cell wall protein DAN4-like [Procambarus clarkii]
MALIFGLVVILATNIVTYSQKNHDSLHIQPFVSLKSSTTSFKNGARVNSSEMTVTDSSLSTGSQTVSAAISSPLPVLSTTSLQSTYPTATSTTSSQPLSTPSVTNSSTTVPSSQPTTESTSSTTVTASTMEPSTMSSSTVSPPPVSPSTMNSTTVQPATTTTSLPSPTSVPPKQHHPGISVAITLFILLAVILMTGVGVWWIRRRRQLERLRHQLMPMYNFDPTDDADDWENQLLEEERSLRPEAEKVQLYSGNSTFDSSQKPSNNSVQKE